MLRRKGTNKKVLVALLAVSMLFVGLYTFMGSNGLMEILRRQNIEMEYKNQLEEAKQENLHLRATIWALKNRLFEVEKIAREQLFLVKPGEKVYLVRED